MRKLDGTNANSPRLGFEMMAGDEFEGEEAEAGGEGAAGVEERFRSDQ
jgi:hypothetical protein